MKNPVAIHTTMAKKSVMFLKSEEDARGHVRMQVMNLALERDYDVTCAEHKKQMSLFLSSPLKPSAFMNMEDVERICSFH